MERGGRRGLGLGGVIAGRVREVDAETALTLAFAGSWVWLLQGIAARVPCFSCGLSATVS